MQKTVIPTILVFAGNDPTGGAGLCADTQTLAKLGCHVAPVVTCTTVQNTHNVSAIFPLAGSIIIQQAEAVLADMAIAACKIGLLGSEEALDAVVHVLRQHPELPVVVDPILAAGGGKKMSTQAIRDKLLLNLLPLTTVLTPNSQEARALTGEKDLNKAAHKLLSLGCQAVCITGTHEDTLQVIHTLYQSQTMPKQWICERLPYTYHGSGCTFASSVAGFMAKQESLATAIEKAQAFTFHALKSAFFPGQGQALPNRVTTNFSSEL